MISGIFHQGSGLGNQLHRFVASRVLALDKHTTHGMLGRENFKGSFIKLPEFADVVLRDEELWQEKRVEENGVDIRGYDPEINFVEEGIIDGEFQDFRYFGHRINDVRNWLEVEPLDISDDLCIINFRGGEFTVFPDLFLTQGYWDRAIKMMEDKYPNIRFEVHTDDPDTAKLFFPSYKIVRDIALNWRSIRYAKHLIIANSSFAILPALLNENVKEVIAPRYWARPNTKVWALPQNYYKQFTYIE